LRFFRIFVICTLVFWWMLLPVDSASANGTISGTVNENGTLTLTAPEGYKISGVQFASYGTPVNYQIGSCHASNSGTKVEEAISNESLTIQASNDVFGDPCSGVGKRLSVILTIEPIVIQRSLSAPTNLQGQIDGSTVTISWDAPIEGNTPVERYAIFWSYDNWASGWAITSTTLNASISDIPAGVQVQIKVRADNDSFAIYSEWSNEISLESTPTPEPTPAPNPTPSIEPTPSPSPTPTAEPSPTENPSPEPTEPSPTPSPEPEPTSEPTPSSSPSPESEPTPIAQPEPTPEPEPSTPEPTPSPSPTPSPEATPTPILSPSPEPNPEPIPAPNPIYNPPVEPTPAPLPDPEPAPIPENEPSLEPEPTPNPETTTEPDPEPESLPDPEPTPQPDESPAPEPVEPPTDTDPISPTPEPQPLEKPTPELVKKEVAPPTLPKDAEFTEPEKKLAVEALLKSLDGEAVTLKAILEAGITLKDLPPATPVEVREDENGNAVIISAEVAIALELLGSPLEILSAIFTSPAQLIFALGNLGADMSDEERDEATKTIIAATIVGNIATTSAMATVGSVGYRRKP
jgi:hypothetical protein